MQEPFGRARVYLTMLLLSEIFLGLAIIIVTAIYQRILGAYMADVERKMLGGQFFNTYILGFQLMVVYACSIAMWSSLWSRRCSPNVNLLLNLWMFFCFVVVFCGFGTIWSLITCADALENTAEMSLLKGIDLYYTCPEWKLLWDGLQYHKECCGVHSYKDWMKASWMPAEATQCQSASSETALAPYACCKHTCATCFENYIPRTDNSRIPYLTLSQINTEGCLPLFTNKMWEILYVLIALVLIAFKLDLLICCLAKYIIRKQAEIDCCTCDNDACDDDDGRPMVVVKCPTTRCVKFDGDEGGNPQVACKVGRSHGGMSEPCTCCSGDNMLRGYTVKQEVLHMSTPSPTQRATRFCNCSAGGGVGGAGGANESRILH
ncbi:uncharacterized protein LOC126767266 [Bactrocera neohumeralis]|uniref:uncharacterized protein LOC120769628 n=1 Tax=Bactrocera tryoni TaxID=59916 RepID=UPI001A979838|nr:uncharacterized protein LOC120769628 [Bactrocera tryoni]XP_050340788.1 uncharacterized protein LOC126767266 [Bactrocera neohumeralis]